MVYTLLSRIAYINPAQCFSEVVSGQAEANVHAGNTKTANTVGAGMSLFERFRTILTRNASTQATVESTNPAKLVAASTIAEWPNCAALYKTLTQSPNTAWQALQRQGFISRYHHIATQPYIPNWPDWQCEAEAFVKFYLDPEVMGKDLLFCLVYVLKNALQEQPDYTSKLSEETRRLLLMLCAAAFERWVHATSCAATTGRWYPLANRK